MSAVTQAPFDTRLQDEGRGLIESAREAGIAVRLMGGMGIRLLLGARYPAAFERSYGDLDVLVRKKDARALEGLIAERGWVPAREFNALNGARRMLFHDPHSAAQVDVFVESFEMCHKLPLADGLAAAGPYSLQAADLLMTKLQIVELNAKDRNDCYALLIGCEGGVAPHERVDADRIGAVASDDWGTHHTFELNLALLGQHLDDARLGEDDGAVVRSALTRVLEAMEAAPKGRSWKMRAKVGERKRWYDEPEEVERDGEG